MEIGVKNDTVININNEMDIELELLTKNINNIKQIVKNNNNPFGLETNGLLFFLAFLAFLPYYFGTQRESIYKQRAISIILFNLYNNYAIFLLLF